MVPLSSCEKKSDIDILETALASDNINIKRVMDSFERFELQIRYTKIDRRNDSVIFTDFDFQLDENKLLLSSKYGQISGGSGCP